MWKLGACRRVCVSERGCQRLPEDIPALGPGPRTPRGRGGLHRWDQVKAPERGRPWVPGAQCSHRVLIRGRREGQSQK